MKIKFYVENVPKIERVVATFSTDEKGVSLLDQRWTALAPYGMHYSAFLLHNPHIGQHGDRFETTDKPCGIKHVLFLKLQERRINNAALTVSAAVSWAAGHQWEIVEIPLIAVSKKEDIVDRENEDALTMIKALRETWRKEQDNPLELYVRFKADHEFARIIFLNSEFDQVRWDGSGFVPVYA